MKVNKPDNLALLFKSYVWKEQCFLSLGLCAFFHLDAALPERLLPEQEMWPLIEESLDQEEVFDFARPKVRGEFLVYGSCFAPQPVPALNVEVRVGSLRKRLAVFGDRRWLPGGIPGTPEPFRRMPIRYGCAFGGADYPLNPLGKGRAADVAGRQPLPNIQDPARLVVNPKDTPPVAGLTAYPLTWPQRTKHLGKFDRTWLTESWPHLPASTDLEFFNAAPEDQRLDGFFKGDETIEILHMHPRQERIVSALPALRARLFVTQREGAKEVFREIPARAETVWLFPDRECGVILYRGAAAVADDEYEDIRQVLAAWEAMKDPARPATEYEALLREKIMTPLPPDAAATPAPSPPDQPDIPKSAAPVAGTISPALATLAARAGILKNTAVAEMKKFGIDPETALKKYLPPPAKKKALSLDDITLMGTRLREETGKTLAKFGLKEEAIQQLLSPKPAVVPLSPEEIIGNLRRAGIRKPELETQIKEAFKASGVALASLAALKKLKEDKERPAERLEEPATVRNIPQPAAGAPLPTVEDIMEKRRKGESLQGMDLTGLDFTGRDLSGADFTNAVMTGTIFRQANLKGAVLRETVITEGDFSEAVLEGAILAGANAARAVFAGTNLAGADLTRGDFTGADLREGNVREAVLSGAVFENSLLAGLRGEKATAVGADFTGADITEADFSQADLTDGNLTSAVLSFTVFTNARADGLRLYGARGEATAFGGCSLRGSRADQDTAFENLRLNHADLTGANWEGARLVRAQLVDTVLDGGDFSRCDLSGAATFRVSARETNFMKADFHEANLTGINLFKGSLRKARLTRADLQFSNLYGADLYKAKLGKTNLTDTNVKNTLLSLRVNI